MHYKISQRAASLAPSMTLAIDSKAKAMKAAGEDVVGFARGLASGGYATDPSYAQKIVAIANSPQMRDALDAIGQAALKKVGVAPNPSQ